MAESTTTCSPGSDRRHWVSLWNNYVSWRLDHHKSVRSTKPREQQSVCQTEIEGGGPSPGRLHVHTLAGPEVISLATIGIHCKGIKLVDTGEPEAHCARQTTQPSSGAPVCAEKMNTETVGYSLSLSLFLSVYLSVCQPVCLSVCLPPTLLPPTPPPFLSDSLLLC